MLLYLGRSGHTKGFYPTQSHWNNTVRTKKTSVREICETVESLGSITNEKLDTNRPLKDVEPP
jgi:hypothetical protein